MWSVWGAAANNTRSTSSSRSSVSGKANNTDIDANHEVPWHEAVSPDTAAGLISTWLPVVPKHYK